MRRFLFLFLTMGFWFPFPLFAQNSDALAPLLRVLVEAGDTEFKIDVLKGIDAALRGRREVPEPEGWVETVKRLGKSENVEVRELVLFLSLKFGSETALEEMRAQLQDASVGLAKRRRALDALVEVRDSNLPEVLLWLLDDAVLQRAALRGLAAFDVPEAPEGIFSFFSDMQPEAQRDALATLASRLTYAMELMTAVEKEKIPAKSLSADVVRKLRAHNDAKLNRKIERLWGVSRSTPEMKLKEIEKYKRIASLRTNIPRNISRGRALFRRSCALCHKLYGEGGTVGPDLTGSDRRNLHYIISNIVDPNAEISNDYRMTIVRMKDGRVLLGVISSREEQSITMATSGEVLSVDTRDILSIELQKFSMMPEGLVLTFTDQQLRDLVAYLAGEGQVSLPDGKAVK